MEREQGDVGDVVARRKEVEVSSKRKEQNGERLQIRTGEPQLAPVHTSDPSLSDINVPRVLPKVKNVRKSQQLPGFCVCSQERVPAEQEENRA